MENILLSSSLTIDSYEKVIDLVHPVLLIKISGALTFVGIIFFFFGKKLLYDFRVKENFLAIVVPNHTTYAKLPNTLKEIEYGLQSSYERIMRMIHSNANPSELTEKIAVATMNYQLKYGCVVWSMYKNINEIVEKIIYVKKHIVRYFTERMGTYTVMIELQALSLVNVHSKTYKNRRVFFRGEIQPVRGSPAT